MHLNYSSISLFCFQKLQYMNMSSCPNILMFWQKLCFSACLLKSQAVKMMQHFSTKSGVSYLNNLLLRSSGRCPPCAPLAFSETRVADGSNGATRAWCREGKWQVRRGFEQSGLTEGVPACGRVLASRRPIRFYPTQTILWDHCWNPGHSPPGPRLMGWGEPCLNIKLCGFVLCGIFPLFFLRPFLAHALGETRSLVKQKYRNWAASPYFFLFFFFF